MARRTLSLKRETLTELSTDELAAMHGAVPPPTPVVLTLPINTCIAVVSLKLDCINTVNCIDLTYQPRCF